ncbi:triosephosphate isomerase [alpha proteobacterium U9-1i]|nr:triosephosphate isomerase [alpha proteobacterium U9-1i]
MVRANSRRPLLAGNWKMFGRAADLAEIAALGERIGAAGSQVEALICPTAPYISAAAHVAANGPVSIGAQDCSAVAEDGARTGEVSAAMLADAGAKYVILGHSERRSQHGESDGLVSRKANAALAAGLIPIVCVGETRADRDSGAELKVVATQVRQSMPTAAGAFVVAYEPVWCIGGDRIPTQAEITDMHANIRAVLGAVGESTRVLYGGAVNPKNAHEVFSCPGVDGALVGRASLKAADFAAIILAHPVAS